VVKFTRARVLISAIAVAAALIAAPLVVGASPASANGTALCQGYSACAKLGMTSHGYSTKSGTEYWRMVSGHNCTNYAAYMMIQAGFSSTRPWSGNGNAMAWGTDNADETDQTPAVGAIAWWNAGKGGAGSAGHVSYVERVVSPTEIITSEDNYGGDFYWRVIYKGSAGWPSGFVHFKDKATSASFPAYRARPLTQSVSLDSAGKKPATLSNMLPGSTAYVTETYQNTGNSTWTGLTLNTATSSSKLAGVGWPATNVATVQREASVITGGVATFKFPITVPSGRPDGTKFSETFSVTDPTGTAVKYASSKLTVTADTRIPFDFAPALGVSIGATAGTSTAASLTAKQGQVLSAVTGTFDPVQPTFTYKWLRNGTAISKATSATYKLTAADVGKKIAVKSTATAAGYLPVTQTATWPSIVKSIYGHTVAKAKKLASGAQIVSSNGEYRVLESSTGRLVVQNRFTSKIVWTNKVASKKAYTKLRSDGVLITYSKAGKVLWHTATKGKHVTKAVVTNSGKLALYSSSGKVIWTSAQKKK
jgi:surface antigen